MFLFVRAATAATFLISAAAFGQSAIPLTLAEAEDLALDNEPGQLALVARAGALREHAVAAGELPDPVLRLGLNNYPIESGDFSTEGMTHAGVGIRQMFPAGRTRELNSRQLEQWADGIGKHADARGRDVLLATRHAWLDTWFFQHSVKLLRESRPFFADLAAITRSLYEVGSKSQQDLLRAELELSRLDDRLIENERQLAHARAMLGEWTGDLGSRPIASALPAFPTSLETGELESALLEHPLVQAADIEVAARETGVELAEQRRKPGWSLDVGYSYREGTLPNGDPRSDFVSVGMTVDLPFFRSRAVDSKLSAALRERTAAHESQRQLQRRLASRLDAELALWRELTRRIELYDERILSQARDHAEASLLAYQSDRADFADVMRGYIDDLDTRTEYLRLQVERSRSFAALASLGGM
jgi:outer membrane protein TolC